MTDLTQEVEERWNRLRRHPAARAGVVWAGASWFVVQAADVLGASPGLTRGLALALAGGLILLIGAVSYSARARAGAGARRTVHPLPAWLTGHRWVVATILFLLLGAVLWAFGPRMLHDGVAPGADRIAVLPFTTSGGGVADYGEGMVTLLTPNLDAVGEIRVVSPTTVLNQWAERARGGVLPHAAALELGRELGAGSVLQGSVTAAGTSIRIVGELYTVDGGVIARERADGPASDMLALVDTLSLRLLRAIWRSREPLPNLRVSAITSGSLPAIRDYLRGERHYRAAAYDSAAAAYRAAMERDSTFALAMLRYVTARNWIDPADPELPPIYARIMRMLDRLPERDRSLTIGYELFQRASRAAYDTARAIVARYPDDPGGWNLLGEVFFHDVVLPWPHDSADRALAQVARLDPTLVEPRQHRLDRALEDDDTTTFAALLDAVRGSAANQFIRRGEVLRRLRWGAVDSIESIVTDVMTGPDMMLVGETVGRVVGWRFLGARTDADPQIAHALLDLMATVVPFPRISAEISTASVAVLADLGRAREAVAEADRLGIAAPTLLHAATGMVPDDLLERARMTSEAMSPAARAAHFRVFHMARGDTAEAKRYGIPAGVSAEDSATLAQIIAATDAQLLLARGDTAAAVAAFDSLARRLPTRGAADPLFVPLLDYALLLARDPERSAEAMTRLRSFAEEVDYPCCLRVAALAGAAAAHEAAGDQESAARLYRRALQMLEHADPFFEPRREALRRALRRLAGDEGL